MRIIEKNITELQEYENNPRNNDSAVEAVAESIAQFGFKVPIIIDADGVIVCGHTRKKAAERLGLETVPCIIADDLTPEQVAAFRLADNKTAELAEWDLQKLQIEMEALQDFDVDLSAFGFDLSAFEDLKEATEDEFDAEAELESIEETRVKRGEVWKLGDHYLMCGDSTNRDDVFKLISADAQELKEIDLVVTDPPYNVAYEGTAGTIDNDNMSGKAFKSFLCNAFANMRDVMKDGAAFYVWYASRESVNFETALQENGLTVRQQLIWAKSTFTLGRQDYQWRHEPCLYGWKDGAAHYFIDDHAQSTVFEDKINVNKLNKSEMKDLLKRLLDDRVSTTVLNEDKPARNAEHPTMKPVRLIGRLIKNSSKQGEAVFDAFGGSGTTLIACEQLKRKCYTMEYDEKFATVILNRYEEFTGKEGVKIA